MLTREGFVYETLGQMQLFLDHNDATLEEVNRSAARRHLDEVVERMAAHAVAQLAGLRESAGETEKQRRLRRELRFRYMRPITTIAGQFLREQPQFSALRMPSWKVRRAGFIAAARDMANAAEQHMELFMREGLEPDFVTELRAAVDRFEQSITAWGESRAQRAGATAGLKAETTRARGLIRVLDALVQKHLRTNDVLMREWQHAKHIRRARTRVSGSSADVPSATAIGGPHLVLSPASNAAIRS
jgi:hypothetical protein